MASWTRTGLVILAIAIVGFFGVWQATGIAGVRGGLGSTVLQSQTPIAALVAVILTIGIAATIGGIVARWTTSATGMFLVGFSLFAMSLKLGGVEEFIQSGGNYQILMLEAVFIGVLILLSAFVVFSIGGPLKDVRKKDTEYSASADMWRAIIIALAILPVMWLVAKSPMKGQMIGSAALGGIAIGFLTRKYTPSMQPVMMYALPIAMGGVGYFIATMYSDSGISAFIHQSISPLLFPMPLEYAAGFVMGLSTGLAWFTSFALNSETETV